MKCKNCGLEIDNSKYFCDDCEKILRKSSSRKEVEELESLIEQNRKLNELENTKELPELKKLVIVDETPKTREERNENIITETREERNETKIEQEEQNDNMSQEFKEPKNNKKKVIIIISVIVVLLILVLCIFLALNNKKETSEEIDYKYVINSYGKSIEKTVSEYMKDSEEVPTWKEIEKLNKYNKYDVSCKVHNIYSDGSIYLTNCQVNGKKVKYSYGSEQEEKKEGKKIEIYSYIEDGVNKYSSKEMSGAKLVGTITCKGEECSYIDAFDNYVLINEDDKYYLYDYESNTLAFGPFDTFNDNYLENLFIDESTLKGIYYKEDSIYYIYNAEVGKSFKTIEGRLIHQNSSIDTKIIYKHGSVIIYNDKDGYNFVNLKTGKVSYSIKNIGNIYTDSSNNIAYITSYSNNDQENFMLYNTTGKLLFDGKKFKQINISEGKLIIINNTEYFVYDSKLRLLNSKKHDEVLGAYNNHIVVLDDNILKILDLDDNVLNEFNEWKNTYVFNKDSSSWAVKNSKTGLYLAIEDAEESSTSGNRFLTYYYIPSTNESGLSK